MGNFARNLFKNVIKAVFPPHLTCDLCKREVFNGEFLCEDCLKTVKFNEDEICIKCGRANLYKPSACPSCKNERNVDLSRSVFDYKGGGESLVKKLKYSDARYLSEPLAKYLKNVYIKNYFTPDVICFVPSTEKTQYKRGYNQAELLARELCRLVNAKCYDILEKVKDTPHQAGLDLIKRRKNLSGAYALKSRKSFKDKKILLIDDVLTTGATASEIAALFKKRGAKSVYLLTLASVNARYLEND